MKRLQFAFFNGIIFKHYFHNFYDLDFADIKGGLLRQQSISIFCADEICSTKWLLMKYVRTH